MEKCGGNYKLIISYPDWKTCKNKRDINNSFSKKTAINQTSLSILKNIMTHTDSASFLEKSEEIVHICIRNPRKNLIERPGENDYCYSLIPVVPKNAGKVNLYIHFGNKR